ncbi:hypothetical protein Gasu2_09680 [Galdieria sulphuraria]|nr:hypothetical protein Gasu2_09680 [Galdieria sulphuraria]
MTSEQLLSISVKERHPPSRRNKPFVSLLGQEEESSRSRSESNSELLARASLSSEVGDSPEGIEASTEQAQRFAYFTENYSASVNQRFQSSGENNATFSAEKPLNTEDSQPVETDELCVLFDVSGSLIREPTVDKPFRIEDVDSIQGIEKYTFSLCDLLTLTRSSLPQQRIAALKAICNVFRSTTDGTLTDDEACSVLEQFQRCNGPSTLIDLLEIPNYMVFYYLLSIVSSLILEVEGYLNHFEERWNTVGLLEEDLQKLKWSSNGTVSENSDSLKNVRSWKKPLIAARLVECFFLSKFLDKLQRFENLSALRNRAYYILALLFVSYIVYYWLQQEGLRCKVAFEIGKVLVKNRKSYDDNFLAKMMTWCLIVLPTSGECLSVVLKLESEKTLYYRIQSLRIVMHLTDGNLVQFDVWCYLKTMIENWKSTDYLIEALPTRECLLLCIEYCKLAKIQNILLDDDASNICPEIFSLLNFLMDYLNGNDDEAIRFYILLVAELFVRLFLGSTPSIRCSLEKRMESLYSYLVSMLNHLQSSCYAGMESVEFVYSQDTEKRAFIFMALRILCLLDRNIHLYFPDIEKLINHAWTTIAKYKDTNKDIFAVSLGIESSKHTCRI